MDKYLMVVMIFLIVTIPLSLISVSTGELEEHPNLLYFYASIAGICIIIIYSSYKDRKQKQKDKINRRSKK